MNQETPDTYIARGSDPYHRDHNLQNANTPQPRRSHPEQLSVALDKMDASISVLAGLLREITGEGTQGGNAEQEVAEKPTLSELLAHCPNSISSQAIRIETLVSEIRTALYGDV